MQPTADFEIWSKYKVVINGIFYCQDDRTRKGGGDWLQTVFWTKNTCFLAHTKKSRRAGRDGGGGGWAVSA